MADKKRTPEEKAMNSERRHSMKTILDQFAEPPPYSSQPASGQASSSSGPIHQLPSRYEDLALKPSLFSSLELPTPADCIAHLKLLHAFAKLRHEVGNHDGLFGIELGKFDGVEKEQVEDRAPAGDKQQPDGVHEQDVTRSTIEAHAPNEEEKKKDALAERIREKRWAVFVNKAIDRFEKWWDSLPSRSNLFRLPIQTSDFDSMYGESAISQFPVADEGIDAKMASRLPPLDVLMVWHSYMLNPRTYLEDCIRMSRHPVWQTCFPWSLIYDSIDNETLEYNPPEVAVNTFENSAGIPWDSFEDDRLKSLVCPRCCHRVTVPWTRPSVTSGRDAIEAYLVYDIGYSGQAFQEACSACNFIITHEKLRVGKFINDADELLKLKRPLPGTILGITGKPQVSGKGKSIATHDPFFPNRVVERLPGWQPPALRSKIETITVEGFKLAFQGLMRSSTDIERVNAGQKKEDGVFKDSKIAVRKLLSHYWDNSSPFGLDLVGAVIRQGSFVQKMRKINWLHSPSVMFTMQRLITKYHRFIMIIADNPKKTAVPTLDVDLAWHTHQLMPKIYYKYTVAETKKFLNHDDKIPEASLNTAFQWTATTYEKKYGQPYSECACWYCECTREPMRSSFMNKFNPLRSTYDVDDVSEKRFPKDPALGPHISAHNAYRAQGLGHGDWAQQRRRELAELDLQYAKVCKRYQKKKKRDETPSRENDVYLYGAYGYPMYYPYPVYVPYYAEPTCEGDRYSSGGVGGCAAGTCTAGASLGGCAGGAGTPGCKASCGGHGDASGGCGTGGGDGGGDGGGCGGCGGG